MAEKTELKPFFRPGIVIFAQGSDDSVYKLFLSIVGSVGIAEPLREGIGIITVHPEPDNTNSALQADYWTIKKMSFSQHEVNAPIPPHKELLSKGLQALLYDITSKDTKDYLEQHEYMIANTIPHIFIVGSPSNPMLGKILRQVHLALPQSPVYYILCSNDNTANSRETSIPPTASLDQQRITSNFCFLYKPYVGDPQFGYSRPEQHCYAAAQALYTLLVTGITEYDEIKKTLTSPMDQNSVTHFGTLSTCLSTTLDRAAQTFCENYLINQLTNWWEKESKDAALLPLILDKQLQQFLESITLANNANPDDIFDLSDDSIKQILTTIKPSLRTNHTKADVQEERKKIEEGVRKRLPQNSNGDMQNAQLLQLITAIESMWPKPGFQSLANHSGAGVVHLYLCALKNALENLPTSVYQNATLHSAYAKKLEEVIANSKSFSSNTNTTEPPTVENAYDVIERLHQQIPTRQVRTAISFLIVAIVLLLGLTPQKPGFMWAWSVAIIIIYIVIANFVYARYYTSHFWHQAEPIYKALINLCYIRAKKEEYQTKNSPTEQIKTEVTSKLQRCDEIIGCSTQIGQMYNGNQLEQTKEAFFTRLETLHDIYLLSNGRRLSERSEPNNQSCSLEEFADSLFTSAEKQEAQKAWNAILYQWMEDTSKPLDKNVMEGKAREIIHARIVKASELSLQSSASILLDVSRQKTSPLNAGSTTIWDYIRQNKLARKYASFPTEPQPLSVFLSGREKYLAFGRESLQRYFQNVIVSDTEGKNDTGVLVAALYSGAISDSIDYDVLFPSQGNQIVVCNS